MSDEQMGYSDEYFSDYLATGDQPPSSATHENHLRLKQGPGLDEAESRESDFLDDQLEFKALKNQIFNSKEEESKTPHQAFVNLQDEVNKHSAPSKKVWSKDKDH